MKNNLFGRELKLGTAAVLALEGSGELRIQLSMFSPSWVGLLVLKPKAVLIWNQIYLLQSVIIIGLLLIRSDKL